MGGLAAQANALHNGADQGPHGQREYGIDGEAVGQHQSPYGDEGGDNPAQ